MAVNTGPLGILTITNGKSTPQPFTGAPIFLPPIPQPSSSAPAKQASAPAPSGSGVYAGGGGGGGGGGYSAPAPDPYAKYGGISGYNALVNNFNEGFNSIKGSGNDAFSSLYSNLQGGAEDLFNTVKTGQDSINKSRENVELNRLNSINDLLDYVRSGIKQGGTRLASMNALDSSAAPAIAQAYSRLGNAQARSVGNQAFLQNRDIDTQQGSIDLQKTSGVTKLQRFRDSEVANISNDVRQQLQSLNEQAVGADIPNRVAIDQEKQRIIDAGMQRLGAVDTWLQGHLSGVSPENMDQVRATAANLRTAGAPATNPFSLELPGADASSPLGGPSLDQLPIFTRAKKTTG